MGVLLLLENMSVGVRGQEWKETWRLSLDTGTGYRGPALHGGPRSSSGNGLGRSGICH